MAALLQPSLDAMRSNPYLEEQSDLSKLAQAVSAAQSGQ